MENLQVQLQDRTEELQRLQEDLRGIIHARQKLEAQQQENIGVQKEFSTLAADANIYKLVGPVLLKQDKSEASLAVDRRLEFIDKEIQRVEKQIAEGQAKSDEKKSEIYGIQAQLQQPVAGTA